MSRDYRLYLEDVLEAIQKIQTYTQELTFEGFRERGLHVDAVLYNLQIIGEAVKHIPENVKTEHADVEWRKIVGLRDIYCARIFWGFFAYNLGCSGEQIARTADAGGYNASGRE